MKIDTVAIIGSGAMGSGIAQVCAMAGFTTLLFDKNAAAVERSRKSLNDIFSMLESKNKITATERSNYLDKLSWNESLSAISGVQLVIEAIVENAEIKREIFSEIEAIVDATCIICSNTSSLSITGLAATCTEPGRFAGLHFFNPAPLMKLVEIIPALQTDPAVIETLKVFVQQLGKTGVIARDSPGFIVNRLARSYYSESLRIYEEHQATTEQIDQIMKDKGGFKMGPFELMDLIGHDINFSVTNSVFTSFFFDPRYKPSHSQKQLVEAGWLGRKAGRGFYRYPRPADAGPVEYNQELGEQVFDRIISMLVNEAVDAVYLGVCSESDADLAMQLGANYPKGLIAWGREIGFARIQANILRLREAYHEDRYRPSKGLEELNDKL
ncbi:MAG TPA: 3-hydroxyacyl-CoA dehydrogenase NAD-binding domain-containing protein [Saprospiraceae bacterium]|nr:3-hydroxyacyl-CoA dehydrogenase NAD-binding domain-containing protein [Saprospiraceae bacterium]HQW54710.1 3-hydroxyacyl-CoA dehydrogenase NAD-binding domain-containing protein [Saprospiraceae bacterium]